MATTASTAGELGTIDTNIPARLDRLPWSRWHWKIVIELAGESLRRTQAKHSRKA